MEQISRRVSRHLPFVYSLLGNFAPHKKIFLKVEKLEKKRPTFTVRLTFCFKRSTLKIFLQILKKISRHLPFVYLS